MSLQISRLLFREEYFCCKVVGIIFTHFVALKMAPLHKFWKLKGSLRSTSVQKGEILQGGRIKYFFNKETPSPLITGAAVSDSVTAAVGHSPSRRSFGSSFTKFFSSSRTPAASHNPSTIFSIQPQALLSTEALSLVFATSAIHCPLLQSCRYSSVKVATEFSDNNLGKLSEAGLYSLTGQTLGGAFSQKGKMIAPKQVVDLKISGLHHVWNEHRLCDKQTQMDTDGVVDVEPCKFKQKVFTSLDDLMLVVTGVDGLCETNDDSEVEECAVGGYIHVQSTILEKVPMQGCLDGQRASSLSIGHYSFDLVSLESVVEDSHGRFAGKESSGLEFSGYHELNDSEDLSRNLDK